MATLDEHGFMQITDRAKDVIKSGGEWISTIEIENIASGHPKAAIAAVIGVAHPKWDERPLLLVVLREGQSATKQEFLDYLNGKIAKWWMPDDVQFVDEIPLGATGKIDKKLIRQRMADYVLPTAAPAPARASGSASQGRPLTQDPVSSPPGASDPRDGSFLHGAVHGFLVADLVVSLSPLFFVCLAWLLSSMRLLDATIAHDAIARGLGAKAALAGIVTGFLGIAAAGVGGFRQLWVRAVLPLALSFASYLAAIYML